MFKTRILTRKYRKLLAKLMAIYATKEKEKLTISDPKEIVMIQMLQLMGIIGDCFKSDKKGNLVLQTERNLITDLAKSIMHELV